MVTRSSVWKSARIHVRHASLPLDLRLDDLFSCDDLVLFEMYDEFGKHFTILILALDDEHESLYDHTMMDVDCTELLDTCGRFRQITCIEMFFQQGLNLGFQLIFIQCCCSGCRC